MVLQYKTYIAAPTNTSLQLCVAKNELD